MMRIQHSWRYLAVAVYLPAIALLLALAQGRELRPSEHGLAYQNASNPEPKSPEMQSFFGGTKSSSSASDVPLPEARNASDPLWRGGGGRRGEGEHVKEVLLVSSLVCGIAGVVLLAVAAYLFLFHFRKGRSSSTSSPQFHHPK